MRLDDKPWITPEMRAHAESFLGKRVRYTQTTYVMEDARWFRRVPKRLRRWLPQWLYHKGAFRHSRPEPRIKEGVLIKIEEDDVMGRVTGDGADQWITLGMEGSDFMDYLDPTTVFEEIE